MKTRSKQVEEAQRELNDVLERAQTHEDFEADVSARLARMNVKDEKRVQVKRKSANRSLFRSL